MKSAYWNLEVEISCVSLREFHDKRDSGSRKARGGFAFAENRSISTSVPGAAMLPDIVLDFCTLDELFQQ